MCLGIASCRRVDAVLNCVRSFWWLCRYWSSRTPVETYEWLITRLLATYDENAITRTGQSMKAPKVGIDWTETVMNDMTDCGMTFGSCWMLYIKIVYICVS